jgi:trehalose 6-phosphate synthase/phosphatase
MALHALKHWVKAVKGQMTVEVKSLWTNKGQVYSRLLPYGAAPDFVLAAGDDATDEDLFARLPESAWTIHVGRNQSRARYYLSKPDDMVALLAQLVASRPATVIPKRNLFTRSDQTLAAKVVNG